MGSSSPCELGVIGLAVMGQNLALNIAEKGFRVAVFNRTQSRVRDTVERAKQDGDLPLVGFASVASFVEALKPPRRILILVQAGAPVDAVLDELLPLLQRDDMVVDCGNEMFQNSERRFARLNALNMRYMAMGVSGGEEGARTGPSLMPGGSLEGYKLLQPVLEKIAANVDGEPCVSYVGPGGAGNYVKMVHNGIEYGDMQLIAEAYSLLKRVAKKSNEQMKQTFSNWNKGILQSYLIEITATILGQPDDRAVGSSSSLVDKILDVAGSKGTGTWTVQEAASKGVACPTIQAALDARFISTLKTERINAAKQYGLSQTEIDSHILLTDGERQTFENDVESALYCSKICSYAQGMKLLAVASQEHDWNLRLAEIAAMWRGGCIIRAQFLNRIREAFRKNPTLPSLLVDTGFLEEIKARLASWRSVVSIAVRSGIPCPALSTSLAYFDSYTSEWLPVNLVQAQRDYFGAHTFKRHDCDLSESFHAQWGR